MNIIQTDSIIYKILKEAGEALNITGGIYTNGERPDNSGKEDIVINNISFEHSTPKRGISNVNIHVPDLLVKIEGIEQYKTDRLRLEELSQNVLAIIESTVINGVSLYCDSSQIFAENNIYEHYINLRFSWIIANPYTTDLDVSENSFLQRLKNLENKVSELEEKINNLNQN